MTLHYAPGPQLGPQPSDDSRGHVVFVHDFSPINGSFSLTAAALLTRVSPESVAEHVLAAYRREIPNTRLATEDVSVDIGRTRSRQDAVIVPLVVEFPSGGGLSLEADLELAEYRPDRCHLHLLGVVLVGDVEPGSQAASLCGRLAVAVVRHVLNDLASVLSESPFAGPASLGR